MTPSSSPESDCLSEMIESSATVAPEELEPLFDSLEPVTIGEMLGSWAGGSFDPEGKAGEMLRAISWHGKRFDSSENVQPLICRDEAGELFAYDQMGEARLREVSFRGVVSAAMVYDRQPIIDYFRRIDEERVMGLMDRKGADPDFYFHLSREDEPPPS